MSLSRFGGFSLPTTGSVGALLSPITSGAQALVDYGAATITQKVSETLGKLAGNGQTDNFNRVSGKIGLTKSAGTTAVTDALTGEQVYRFETTEIVGSLDRGESNALTTSDFKVKLTSNRHYSVVFDVMPTIDESHSAEYAEFNPMHHPGAIVKYRRTTARTWSINAKLIARNPTEANANLTTINTIRAWVMPQYGIRTGNRSPDTLGAPPPILTLSAYGNRVIGPIKCVLESFRWTFQNDVDYLPTLDVNLPDQYSQRAPFPAIIDVTLTLKESWSPAEFSNFDLDAYVQGRLTGEDGAYFARRVGRAQQNTTPAPVGPSSQDNFMSGTNAARKSEVSEPKEVDQKTFISGDNSVRAAENAMAAKTVPTAVPKFVSGGGGDSAGGGGGSVW